MCSKFERAYLLRGKRLQEFVQPEGRRAGKWKRKIGKRQRKGVRIWSVFSIQYYILFSLLSFILNFSSFTFHRKSQVSRSFPFILRHLLNLLETTLINLSIVVSFLSFFEFNNLETFYTNSLFTFGLKNVNDNSSQIKIEFTMNGIDFKIL